jgi:hypothetical protein
MLEHLEIRIGDTSIGNVALHVVLECRDARKLLDEQLFDLGSILFLGQLAIADHGSVLCGKLR